MALTIEMTPRGVLLAGAFRTEAELNTLGDDAKRNTMIAALIVYTSQPVEHFQRFTDDDLVGKLAVTVFLLKAEILSLVDLKRQTDDAQRNTLIAVNNARLDRPVDDLQRRSNKELVQIGLEWFAKSRAIAAIVSFTWDIDHAKLVGTRPEVIQIQTYDNRGSSTELEAEFSFTKTIVNTSSFAFEAGFEISTGFETTFKAGVPYLAENETTVSLSTSMSNTWRFGEENSTEQQYSHRSSVKVPPRGHIQRTASVTRGTMSVPYHAKVRSGDGTLRDISGTWHGVSTVNCVAKQVDL